MLRARRATQIVSLLFFMIILLRTQYPLGAWHAISDLYLQSSMFLAASVWLNAWRFTAWFAPALVLIVLTFVLGRFFCGWLCPMGATLDVTDRLVARKPLNDGVEPLHAKWFKYALLVVALVAAYFEANLAGWLDPISLISRTFTQAFIPAADFIAKLLRDGLFPIPVVHSLSEPFFRFLRLNVLTFNSQSYHGTLAIFLIFLAVVFAGRINRRFWCRFVCPLGAMHAILSRFSIFKKTVEENKCISCGKCARNCRMGAITSDGITDYRGECIECFTCQAVCPTGAVSFRPVRRGSAVEPVNLSRRGFIFSTASGLVAAPLVRINWEKDARRELTIVRPPGVWNEDRFMQTCVRCGQCMRVCPTNCLQPEWFQNGVEGLWSPHIATRFAECVYTCNLCGVVCPSGAIEELKVAAKQRTVIGAATVNRGRCIPWAQDKNCAVCEEHCPVPKKAIRLESGRAVIGKGSVKRPVVLEELCIGCGICESRCPVPGPSAIQVAGIPQYTRPEPESSARNNDFNSLFPKNLPPWKPGKITTYPGDRLFEYIDGAADVYLEYGFDAVASREYVRGDSSFVVDLFRMKDSAGAFGIYRNELAEGLKPLIAGQGGAVSGTQGTFWKGRFYVKISGFGTVGEKDVQRFASAVDRLIRERGEIPPAVGMLPLKSNIVKDSERYIRGPLTMRNFMDTKNKDIFGFKQGADASWCLLSFGSKQICVLVARFPKTAARDAAVANLKTMFAADGYAAQNNSDFDLVMTKSGSSVALRTVPGNAIVVYPELVAKDFSLIGAR